MKNRNTLIRATLCALAIALVPVTDAAPRPDGGPIRPPANEAPRPDGGPVSLATNDRVGANSEASSAYAGPQEVQLPVITIHSTGDVKREKTGSFVLDMHPLMFGGMYVNFSLSGTAIPGVDYIQPLSPAYIGQSGYGVILIQTLPDPRAGPSRRAYDVVVTLEPGAGYALGIPSSARMWIKP